MILFGTGKSVIPPPKEIKDYISSLGIQLEVMDSVSPQSNVLCSASSLSLNLYLHLIHAHVPVTNGVFFVSG